MRYFAAVLALYAAACGWLLTALPTPTAPRLDDAPRAAFAVSFFWGVLTVVFVAWVVSTVWVARYRAARRAECAGQHQRDIYGFCANCGDRCP